MRNPLLILLAMALLALPAFGQPTEDVTTAQTGQIAAGPVTPAPTPEGTVLFDNGPVLTSVGTGFGGADESVLENVTLGMTTLGGAIQGPGSTGNRMADDFTVPDGEEWQIDECDFFNYQTGAPPTSTTAAVNLQIWDGDPSGGGSVIFGDLTTDRLSTTGFTNIYRVAENTPGDNLRAIFVNTVTVGTTLAAGTYWLDWSPTGSGSFSGPWMPPVTIPGQNTTGDGLQFFAGAWQPFADGGTATNLGMPFICRGAVLGGEADLSVDATCTLTGSTITCDVNASNAGPDDETNAVVEGPVPMGTAYNSDTCGGADMAGVWTWGIGALAAGGSAGCTVTYDVTGGGPWNFDYTITGDLDDTDTGNNASVAFVQEGILEIPTLSEIGLGLLVLLLTGSAFVFIRRRG
ncbi:MAG: IPTL-CTERM sorting domain-containing protein [Acidobacteriota bacterium]